MISQIVESRNIIFLDECSFNLNMNRKKGWNISAKRIFVMDAEKSINYSLLAAISKDKLIAYIVAKGSITTEIYTYFISRLLEIVVKEGNLANTLFVADNNTAHKSYFIQRIFLNKNNFAFLPPYSSELNPIELCWSKLKRLVRKGGLINSEDDLIFRIYNSAKKIDNLNCKNWFRHTLNFFKKSFLKQSFY